MRSVPVPYAGLVGLVCLVAGGCATSPLGEALNAPSAVLIPAAVTDFSRNAAESRPGATATRESDGPRAAITLAQYEDIPSNGAEGQVVKDMQAPEVTPGPPLKMDLGGVLARVANDNPRVGFALAQVQEAFARLQLADAQWFPNLQAGVSYNRHDGPLQNTDGTITQVSRQALNTGLGAGALGSGTPPVAGLSTRLNLGEAIFAPKVLGNEANARQAAFTATLNDTLLATALAYLDLLDAYQQRAIALDTLANAQKLTKYAVNFANAGQAPQADAERAKTELALRRLQVERTTEAIRVASARLLELLNLNTLIVPEPIEPAVPPIGLVPLGKPLPELVSAALSNRPELAESRFLVTAAVEALRQQKLAPLIPSVILGVSDSGFGGGRNDTMTGFSNRFDFDAVLYWQLRNLGFGDKAIRTEFSARVREARLREVQVMDQVAREVAEDFAQVQSRAKQIAIAADAVTAAHESVKLNFKRFFEGGVGLPIEVLQSIQALDQALREQLRAVADYDRAQFRLYRDLGWPPH
jgi:outer membrane protein TolC